jgi:hypothetical protein
MIAQLAIVCGDDAQTVLRKQMINGILDVGFRPISTVGTERTLQSRRNWKGKVKSSIFASIQIQFSYRLSHYGRNIVACEGILRVGYGV